MRAPSKRSTFYRAFAAVSLLEYGGLKPILPFLEGRSDAACRVVFRSSRLPPMEPPMVFTTPRRAASLRSSNNCKCLIETFFIARGKALSIKD